MELAAHWHRCQNLQKTSDYFYQQYTYVQMMLSRIYRIDTHELNAIYFLDEKLFFDHLPVILRQQYTTVLALQADLCSFTLA